MQNKTVKRSEAVATTENGQRKQRRERRKKSKAEAGNKNLFNAHGKKTNQTMSASTHYTLTCLDNWLPSVGVCVREEVQFVGAWRRFSLEWESEKERERECKRKTPWGITSQSDCPVGCKTKKYLIKINMNSLKSISYLFGISLSSPRA